MTLMWQPAKVFVACSMFCLMVMALLAMHPIEMWLTTGMLREDMIYRLLFCSLMGTAGLVLLSAGVVCARLRQLADERPRRLTFLGSMLDRCFTFRGFSVGVAVCVPLLAWLVGRGVWTWVTAGYVDVHWSRVMLAGLVAYGLGQMLITTLIANLLRYHISRKVPQAIARVTEPVSADASVVDAPSPAQSEVPATTRVAES